MSMAELGSAAPTSGGVSHIATFCSNETKRAMHGIALLLDPFPVISSLPKPSLLDRWLYVQSVNVHSGS